MQSEDAAYDVIVVGGGGSGLAAAASAAEHGARVLLLEKQPSLGGTTGIAVGSFTANGTVFQTRAGVEDSLDAHAEDCGKFAPEPIESRNAVGLRRFFLSHTAETLDWLCGMGLVFHGPSPEPPNRVPRMHNVAPSAKAYIDALAAKTKLCGGTILCDAGVDRLVVSDGVVTGVITTVSGRRREFTATCGVILAAGDYANSPHTIARFKGDAFSAIEGINPHSTGYGHVLAERAGARLVNMDVTYGPELRFIPPPVSALRWLSKLPSHGRLATVTKHLIPLAPRALVAAVTKRLIVTWQHPENALFDDGAILVNQRGERFCDERQWPEREIAVARQPGKIAYLLLDEGLCDRYSQWPHFISTAPQIAYAYVEDYLRLRPDVAVTGDSLEGVAQVRDIPANALRVSAGDMRGNRWVLLGPVKAYFTTTEGGAAIDMQFRVLDETGLPIPGLYAVGQNGLGGQILWGHGLHIAWAITSGRLCGKLLSERSQSGKSNAKL
ncbi:MAG: FAD-dependent oxidoreductase [Planctomycetaceae bacterium]